MSASFCRLPGYAILEVRGRDAAEFLQGQLSRAVESLDSSQAPLAGWHDARGRVRALFRVLRLPDRWLLVTASDTLEATLKRLKMFVLRSDVSLHAAADWGVAMLVGADGARLRDLELPAAAGRNAVMERRGLYWLRVGPGVYEAVGPQTALDGFEPSLARGAPAVAELVEIELGIPLVTGPLVDRYVAQMLNLDRLDALSFDKGCYPGQEVIARVQHLGTVKRRLRRYASAVGAVPAIGAEVRTAERQPAGEITRAVASAAGFEALAVVDDAAAGAQLFVDEAALHEQPLP